MEAAILKDRGKRLSRYPVNQVLTNQYVSRGDERYTQYFAIHNYITVVKRNTTVLELVSIYVDIIQGTDLITPFCLGYTIRPC